MSSQDDICPEYIGASRIRLSIAYDDAKRQLTPRVGVPLALKVDYADAAPEGVVLPLELVTQPPTRAAWNMRVFRRFAPRSIIWVPLEAGVHNLVLRERYHNGWRGTLLVTVLEAR